MAEQPPEHHQEAHSPQGSQVQQQEPSFQELQTQQQDDEFQEQPGEYEVDEDRHSDADSTFDEVASRTTSLKSSIFKYRYENGRRYHAYKDGEYWGPNDEGAQDHLDIAHHLYNLTFNNKLYLAPLSETVGRVLDIGTGTGIWAIDFADQHPESEVVGTDLSPIQPGFVPPNVKFEIDDAADTWTWPPDHFDYIHMRSLFGCFSDWDQIYSRVMRHLKPGGYFEQIEMAPGFRSSDGTVESHPIGTWHDLGMQCGEKAGKSFGVMYFMADKIRAAGFEDVKEEKFVWPLGAWPRHKGAKEVGRWARLHTETGLENWSLAVLTRVMDWSLEEAQILIAKLRRDLRDPKIHGWHEMRVVYGRKPEGPAEI